MCSIKLFALSAISLCVFTVVCLSCSGADAAVFTQRATYHREHPGKCFDRITQRALLPNKEYRPKGICAAMTCDINTLTINIETCPHIEVPGCEQLPPDPTWMFPKCCPQYKCIDFKTGKAVILSL